LASHSAHAVLPGLDHLPSGHSLHWPPLAFDADSIIIKTAGIMNAGSRPAPEWQR
jgi:hypothetical protein